MYGTLFVPHPGCDVCLPAFLPLASAVATISTAARSTLRLRPSFVDVQCSTVQVSAVETVDCGVRFRIDAHLDEGEASGLARVTVRYNVYPVNGPI